MSDEHIGQTTTLNLSEQKTNSEEIPIQIDIHDSNEKHNGCVKIMMRWELPVYADVSKY